MTLPEVIEQLRSLRDNSESFLDPSEEDSIWRRDIEALDAAIAVIEEYPLLERRLGRLERRWMKRGKKTAGCSRLGRSLL